MCFAQAFSVILSLPWIADTVENIMSSDTMSDVTSLRFFSNVKNNAFTNFKNLIMLLIKDA
jgi:hypothetical protein